MASVSAAHLSVDAKELVLSSDERFVCETYIFEPTRQEAGLGHLFAVGEIEDRGGVGRDLLDLTITAIQKEYFRDPTRSPAQSFELALHQANLLLNDSAERGVKDWMGYFNVAVCVLSGSTLHISVAGQASVSLVRKTNITEVSEGLSVYPVTNPLRTFSQVASGSVSARDVLYIGSANFRPLFRGEDLKRFAIDHSAHTIVTRLEQLYSDYGLRHPLGALVVSLLPQYVAPSGTAMGAGQAAPVLPSRRGEAIHQASLTPRQPLVLKRSSLLAALLIIGKFFAYAWEQLKRSAWPALRQGSVFLGGQARRSGVVLFQASRQTVSSRPTWEGAKARLVGLPRSSKIFAVLAVLFAIALAVSLVLLKQKRAEDARIEHASEQLHSARVAKDAAAAALIYDNREEAEKQLSEAERLAAEVESSGLYQEDIAKLKSEITAEHDRLQKIFRASGDSVQELGTWAEYVTAEQALWVFVIGDSAFTFDPKTNAILRLAADGNAERVTQTTEGVGFFVTGAAHPADKTIVLATDAPGVALFDSNNNSLLRQEITFPNEQTRVGSLAVFGSRLYVHDQTTGQIHSYGKSLRGYSGGEAWIADGEFPKDTIRSIAIDGNVFTLHADGTVMRLFKGVPAEFTLADVSPPLAGATKIITSEEHRYLYVVDPKNKRVVIFTKEGELVRQIFVEDAADMKDADVPQTEDVLYVLDGTRVLKVSLVEGE